MAQSNPSLPPIGMTNRSGGTPSKRTRDSSISAFACLTGNFLLAIASLAKIAHRPGHLLFGHEWGTPGRTSWMGVCEAAMDEERRSTAEQTVYDALGTVPDGGHSASELLPLVYHLL